jgi:hypothetical protein
MINNNVDNGAKLDEITGTTTNKHSCKWDPCTRNRLEQQIYCILYTFENITAMACKLITRFIFAILLFIMVFIF